MGSKRTRNARKQRTEVGVSVTGERITRASLTAHRASEDPAEQLRRLGASALRARERAEELEASTVVYGRSRGVSWDVLGRLLDIPGETLRRRYARRG